MTEQFATATHTRVKCSSTGRGKDVKAPPASCGPLFGARPPARRAKPCNQKSQRAARGAQNKKAATSLSVAAQQTFHLLYRCIGVHTTRPSLRFQHIFETLFRRGALFRGRRAR